MVANTLIVVHLVSKKDPEPLVEVYLENNLVLNDEQCSNNCTKLSGISANRMEQCLKMELGLKNLSVVV